MFQRIDFFPHLLLYPIFIHQDQDFRLKCKLNWTEIKIQSLVHIVILTSAQHNFWFIHPKFKIPWHFFIYNSVRDLHTA